MSEEIILKDVDYEVALEILGQSKAPFVNARYEEWQKPKEEQNQKLLNFLNAKMNVIDDLMDDLDPFDPKDAPLIKAILDPKNTVFRTSD